MIAIQYCNVHPQVANAGDGLQIWTVVANILDKQ
jgi:hypothetical protein